MEHLWDEFSKSLAEAVPRRESLRRFGAIFAGAVLTPLSMGLGAAKGAGPDACKTFCNRCPNQKRSQCLAACQACNGNTSRLCGTCGNYACCASSTACCGGACVDFLSDFNNCGGCGYACDAPGPYEDGACIDGTCLYQCVTGALFCNGTCTPVLWDPNNCGACGNVCPASAPYCDQGVCTVNDCDAGLTKCGRVCISLLGDSSNCGACGNICPLGTACSFGTCQAVCPGCGGD